MSDNCLFCKIRDGEIPGEIVYRDDDVIAFKDINPAAPTHVLVIPTEHVSGVAALEERHAQVAGKLMLRAAAIAKEQGLRDFRLNINNGASAGQSVFHLHLHLLGGRQFEWPPG